MAQAQLHIELRKQFAEINAALPRGYTQSEKSYHEKGWFPSPDREREEFKIFERYWYLAFDEWFITKILHRLRFQKLWYSFFERAIFEGMKNDPIRYVLFRMVKDDRTSFSGWKDQFVEDLTAAYNKYKRPQMDPPTIFDGFTT